MVTRKTLAQRENFTIYMLMGWKRFAKQFMKGPLSKDAMNYINESIDYAITDIKQTQAARQSRQPKRK